MQQVRVGSIALGVVVDKATFVVLAGVLSALLPTGSTAFSLLALLLGTTCTTLGAYVAAARAQEVFMIHGILVACAGFAISFARYLAFTINPPSDPGTLHPLWWEFVGWSLVFVAGALGGTLAKRRSTMSVA